MARRSPGSSPRPGIVAVMGMAVALAAIACTPLPPTTPGGNGPPVISQFAPTWDSGSAPLTTAFSWVISDPDQDPLTCEFDFDDDGYYEVTEHSCTSASKRSATFWEGTSVVRLRVSDATSSVVATATVATAPPTSDSFEITVRFVGGLSPSQQGAFDAAAARWSEVIRSGLPDVSLDLPAGDCAPGVPAFSGTVDDLLIDAASGSIDGPGGILAQAGPCLVRTGGGLPAYGAMLFDTADLADLEAAGQMEDVIRHEMGHVLGIGTVWGSLLSGAGTSDPTFTGSAARGAWDAVAGGSGISVPVENSGGAGTADAHWRESVFGNELMTGYLDPGTNPLSAVTVGSLADIGYGVDLGAADPFGTAALRRTAAPGREIRTELIFPKGTVGS